MCVFLGYVKKPWDSGTICGRTGSTEKTLNQQTVLQRIYNMQCCDLCFSSKFLKFSSCRKKSPFLLWFNFVSLKKQQWKNLIFLDFLSYSKNQNWSKVLEQQAAAVIRTHTSLI